MTPLLKLLAVGASQCQVQGGSLFGFPKWYKYLDGIQDSNGVCIPHVQHLTDIWFILAAVLEILLRLAVLMAVLFIAWGGIMFITSHGEPDKINRAKDTVIYSLVGLAFSVGATAIITFIAGKF
jgi:hypothetical protein